MPATLMLRTMRKRTHVQCHSVTWPKEKRNTDEGVVNRNDRGNMFRYSRWSSITTVTVADRAYTFDLTHWIASVVLGVGPAPWCVRTISSHLASISCHFCGRTGSQLWTP